MPPIVHEVLRSSGQPLDPSTRAFMEPRFGHDFGQVRVHNDTGAAKSVNAVNAKAYTVGRNIVFGLGHYQPHSTEGRILLAHELAHTIHQSGAESATLQRELAVYKAQKSYTRTTLRTKEGNYEESVTIAADADNIAKALDALIKAQRVGRQDTDELAVFYNIKATRDELVQALTKGGLKKVNELSNALLDNYNIFAYSHEEIKEFSGLFGPYKKTTEVLYQRELTRGLTTYEQTQAKSVFGNSLDYSKITLREVGIFEETAIAPWYTIYFPAGSFSDPGFMPWLIHELTHCWQTQHGVSIVTKIYYAAKGKYDYGDELGLLNASKSNKKFTDFNTEQQGDILRDYYIRKSTGQNISAWEPFVKQVQSPS